MTRELATVLFDSSPLFREGLSLILATTSFKVFKSAGAIDEIDLAALPKFRRLLFLLAATEDASALAMSIRNLKLQFPSALVALLSDTFGPNGAMAALEAGATGYILKTTDRETLIKSLELILLDRIVLPAEYQKLIHATSDAQAVPQATPSEDKQVPPCDPILQRLSPRESVILHHLMLGNANKIIARELGITDATVKVHIKAILRKIRVTNRTQAALWAVEQRKYLLQGASPDEISRPNGKDRDVPGDHQIAPRC